MMVQISSKSRSSQRRIMSTQTPSLASPDSSQAVRQSYWFALKSKLLLLRGPGFSDFVTTANCPTTGIFDGIAERNRWEQDSYCTHKLLSTVRVTMARILAVTR